MRIDCPACSASGHIDESKVPEEGRTVVCPRCSARFDVRRERTGAEIIQKRERMVCPQCGCEQPLLETCAICGIVIKDYVQTRVRQREKERLEFVRLRTATRDVDAWYSNLFDRRLSSLVVRVLSLLVLLGLFMTCSMNSAKRNRFYEEMTAEQRRATEGSSVNRSPEGNDPVFADRFGTAVDLMTGSTDACIGQNYNYKTSWPHNSQPGYLTESLENSLSRINLQRREAETAVNRLPTPSRKYQACHVKIRELADLNRQVCTMANNYQTHYRDFTERLSNFNFEFSRIKVELNDCTKEIR